MNGTTHVIKGSGDHSMEKEKSVPEVVASRTLLWLPPLGGTELLMVGMCCG
jgi:hypothetical protein